MLQIKRYISIGMRQDKQKIYLDLDGQCYSTTFNLFVRNAMIFKIVENAKNLCKYVTFCLTKYFKFMTIAVASGGDTKELIVVIISGHISGV